MKITIREFNSIQIDKNGRQKIFGELNKQNLKIYHTIGLCPESPFHRRIEIQAYGKVISVLTFNIYTSATVVVKMINDLIKEI